MRPRTVTFSKFLQFQQFNLSFIVFRVSSKFNFLHRVWSYVKWTPKILIAFLTVLFLLLARDLTVSVVDFWPFPKNNTTVFSKLIFSPECNEKLSTMYNKVSNEVWSLRNAAISSANISSFISSFPTTIPWYQISKFPLPVLTMPQFAADLVFS